MFVVQPLEETRLVTKTSALYIESETLHAYLGSIAWLMRRTFGASRIRRARVRFPPEVSFFGSANDVPDDDESGAARLARVCV
jgi:hypothetical protein